MILSIIVGNEIFYKESIVHYSRRFHIIDMIVDFDIVLFKLRVNV